MIKTRDTMTRIPPSRMRLDHLLGQLPVSLFSSGDQPLPSGQLLQQKDILSPFYGRYWQEENGAIEISDIAFDSRRVQPGSLFVAISGYQQDGLAFIDDAIKRGASGVVVSISSEPLDKLEIGQVAIIEVNDCRFALAHLSTVFFDRPWQDVHLYGVTGTNGKTSICYILEKIWQHNNLLSGLIGTIEYKWPGMKSISSNTTPESRDLVAMIDQARQVGCQRLVMEVSSHALYLSRVEGLLFRCAIFTNLTQDHLDFHPSMEDYFLTKCKLFASERLQGQAVVYVSDRYGTRLAHQLLEEGRSLSVLHLNNISDDSLTKTTQYILTDIQSQLHKTSFTLIMPDGQRLTLCSHLRGEFNAINCSLAAIAYLENGGQTRILQSALEDATLVVPGRFEVVNGKKDPGFVVVVDYAHTPDALENILTAARKLKPRRLLALFGCGGDRDKGKRPAMARIAEELADLVIVTSDNPRTEQPEAIIADIMQGFKHSHPAIVNRRQAIFEAVGLCQAHDLLVIAGKGHEDYQILGKKKIHFDDREVARQAIDSL